MSSSDALAAWLNRFPEVVKLFDPKSTEADIDEVLETRIDHAIRWLEENAKRLKSENEDGLTTILAGKVEMPGLNVILEANSNGHVDFTFEVGFSLTVRKRLGEAKLYHGPAYHLKGLDQLLERYATGRDRSAYVFDYFRENNIKTKMLAVRATMNTDRPLQQTCEAVDHQSAWAFVTHHSHKSGETIRIVHFGVNLFF